MTTVDTLIDTKDSDLNDINILIVEDERIVALDIKERVRSLGYNVVGMAHTGEQAIKIVEDKHPNLILMDIMLKGSIDGITTTEKIHQNYNIPVIYLTAYSDEVTLNRAKITEPSGYLLKPFEERELHTTIQTAMYNYKMELKLRESEEWLSTTLDSIGEGMIATGPDMKIKTFNPVAEKLMNIKKSEAEGMLTSEIYTIIEEESGKEIEDIISQVIRSKKLIELNNHICVVKKNNFKFSIKATATPIRNNGNIIGTVLVFQDITEQKQAEKEREDLLQEVIDARERLKQLSKKLIEIQEKDRRYFAYELHEQIGQSLTTIKINLQSVLSSKDENYKDSIEGSVELLDNIIKEVRRLSLTLRPSMLDDLGLLPAIRWYVNSQIKNTKIKAAINAEDLSDIPEDIENMCYRITQEAVANVIEHSEADDLIIKIVKEDGFLYLTIKDNGKGFSLKNPSNKAYNGSIGITGMKERVELLGGDFNIASLPGLGTTVTASFPLTEENEFEKKLAI